MGFWPLTSGKIQFPIYCSSSSVGCIGHNELPLCTLTRVITTETAAVQEIAGCGLEHPAIQLTKLGLLSENYDFGEAAGLAFSFFVPFSALAAFTSTSFAVIV